MRGSSVVPGLPMMYSTPAACRISKKACRPAIRGICRSPLLRSKVENVFCRWLARLTKARLQRSSCGFCLWPEVSIQALLHPPRASVGQSRFHEREIPSGLYAGDLVGVDQFVRHGTAQARVAPQDFSDTQALRAAGAAPARTCTLQIHGKVLRGDAQLEQVGQQHN